MVNSDSDEEQQPMTIKNVRRNSSNGRDGGSDGSTRSLIEIRVSE